MSKTITITESALAAMIAAEVAKAVQTTTRKSDFKIVVTRGIPSKSGREWGTVEIVDQRTGAVTKTFIDRTHNAGKRKDGATQEVIYASEPAAKPAAPAAPAETTPTKTNAAVKAAVAASRKSAAKA
jgi:hypothetical protein